MREKRFSTSNLLTVLLILGIIGGALLFAGDGRWAKKESLNNINSRVIKIEAQTNYIEKEISYIGKIFREDEKANLSEPNLR